MLSKQTLSSKAAIIALLVFLVFLGQLKYKQWKSQQGIEKEKQIIQAQADVQQKKNDELSQSLSYLNSPSFKERVARQQLNLKRDGEQVYSFAAGPPGPQQSQGTEKTSGLKKWWNYFFTN